MEAETGTAIGWIWMVALIGGPLLLAAVFGIGMARSRRRAPQRPLSPGEPDRTAGSSDAAGPVPR